jgi:hypothetical protein
LIGIGFRNYDVIIEEDDEEDLLAVALSRLIDSDVDTLYYAATRQFDEMVLKGRFTNARRAHLPRPGPWPHWPILGDFEWVNLGPIPKLSSRPDDILSKDVPTAWAKGDRASVIQHLGYDLKELRQAMNDREYGRL